MQQCTKHLAYACCSLILVAVVMAIGAGLAAGLPYFAVAAVTSLLFGICLNV